MLRAGAGWRLGWDEARRRGLIGAETWAFEVDGAEFQDLVRLLPDLVATMAALADELADSEELTCEAASDRLRLTATGFPERYRVHVQVGGDRPAEGFWESGALAELLAVLAGSDL